MPMTNALPGQFTLLRGSSGDYQQLACFHYRHKNPSTWAAVWIVVYQPHGLSHAVSRTTDHSLSPAYSRVLGEGGGEGALNNEHLSMLACGLAFPCGEKLNRKRETESSVIPTPPHPNPLPIPRRTGGRGDRRRRAKLTVLRQGARLVAVGVLSWPTAVNRGRDRWFGLMGRTFGEKIRFANANLRTISRIIVHPQFRS